MQFILDHCGVPDIAAGAFSPWDAHIAALAAEPNLVAKLSGIIAYGGTTWSLEPLRPHAEHVIASFGPDRMVWGSDMPVCTLAASLEDGVGATHALLAGLTEAEQAAILHGTAERIYLGGTT